MPVVFRNASPAHCALQPGRTYRAAELSRDAIDTTGTGWSLDTLALEVRATPNAPLGTRLVADGTAVLRVPGSPSTGPTLVVAAGAIALDALAVDGGVVTFNAAHGPRGAQRRRRHGGRVRVVGRQLVPVAGGRA